MNHETGNYYTLGHLSQITGLTDRTLRTYLKNGILEGEKISGIWHFTAAQLDAFLRHPTVRPSLIAKKNATVYDFLLESKRTEPRICVILDLPGADREAVSEFFCGAITGGDFAPTLNGAPIETNRAYLAEGGDVLALPIARRGARAYIALAGGLAVDEVMGSRSTCLKAGIGGLEGRAIRAGDRLGLRAPRISLPQGAAIPPALLPRCGDPVALRFTYGPQDDLFTAAGKRAFIGGTYALSDRSDRMGYRLEGPTVALIPGCDGNIVSDGVCFGAIEITGGQPIVMMADRQTTGGYPKIGCVIGADLPRLAQCKAGDRVRFRPVSVAAAQEAYRRQRQALDSFENGFGKEADHD